MNRKTHHNFFKLRLPFSQDIIEVKSELGVEEAAGYG